MSYSIRIASVADMADVVRLDDDATGLYQTAGFVIALPADHPFTVDEQRRWAGSAAAGQLFFAVDERGECVGFAALDRLDGVPYLDQLSVRRAAMKRGAGRFLLHHAITWATRQRAKFLWLTTYGHLPWNRPFYEREGFVLAPESECSPGIVHHLDDQRAALPFPEHRVAMRRAL
jgi:GNAT superfamily N-acetyltransferase